MLAVGAVSDAIRAASKKNLGAPQATAPSSLN